MARLPRVMDERDRSATLSLLPIVLSPTLDAADRAPFVAALASLEDPRVTEPLEQALRDRTASIELRAAALDILSSTPLRDRGPERVLADLRSRDPFVQAFGYDQVDAPLADWIPRGAASDAALVRRHAVDAACLLTRTRPLVRAVQTALDDPEPEVREAACRVAYFDEPLALGWPLIERLDDDDADVREAAHMALEEYPQVAVLLALADLDGASRDEGLVSDTLEALVNRIWAAMRRGSPRVRRAISEWLRPVRWLVDGAIAEGGEREGTGDDGENGESERAFTRPDIESLHAEVREAVLDPDSPPQLVRHVLAAHDWSGASSRTASLLHACAESSCWELRGLACRGLADRRDVDVLLRTAGDPEGVVRGAALSSLATLDLTDRSEVGDVLERARATLLDPWLRPVAGDSALAALVRHADRTEVVRALVDELSRAEDRDGLFRGVIAAVRRHRIEEAIPSLLAMVAAPVVASVNSHVDALVALRAMEHPRDRIHLSHLRGIDHLSVQAELAEWG